MEIQPVDKVIIQPVQQEIKQEAVPFGRQSMGYTGRPINAPSQVMNIPRYLDSIFAGKEVSVPNNSATTVTGWSFSKTGKIFIDNTIPELGTYMIICGTQRDADNTGLRNVEVLVNGTATRRAYDKLAPTDTLGISQSIVFVGNFSKGDDIDVRLYQTNTLTTDLNVFVDIQIIKLS